MPLSLEDILTPVGAPDGISPGRAGGSDGRPGARGRTFVRAFVTALVAAAAMAIAGCATTGSFGSGDAAGAGGRFRLPPVVWWDRSPDGSREVRNFLGFLYGQRAESIPADGAIPEGRVVSRNSLHILWPLYHRSAVVESDGMRTTTRSLMPFVWASRKSEPSGRGTDYVQRRVIVPLLLFSLKSDNYGSGQLEYEFLWPLGKYSRGERFSGGRREMARSFVFWPFVRYRRTWPLPTDGPGPDASASEVGPARSSGPGDGAGRPGEMVVLRVLKPIFGYERDTDLRRKRVFILGGVVDGEGEDEDKEGQRTLGLLAAEKGPATDYEIQALWQFFMVKRSGSEEFASRAFAAKRPSDMWRATKWLFGGSPRKQFRFGPIVDYEADWSGDRKEFSVLFGLVSYFREGNRRRGRFLWVIPWRP
ncbi:MAG: hypothetical protein ACYTKD_11870 [Planctomycetota bacterium]|jgi:hypothetical protein